MDDQVKLHQASHPGSSNEASHGANTPAEQPGVWAHHLLSEDLGPWIELGVNGLNHQSRQMLNH